MWFTEDALTPCAVFGAAGLMTLLTGLNSRRRLMTAGGFLLIVLAGSSWIIDAGVVTDREEIESLVRALCEDFRHKRAGTLDYFSPTAVELRAAAAAAMALVTINDGPRLTDFDIKLTNQGTRATAHFRANATINVKAIGDVGHQPSRFILTFSREQQAWKIIKVQRMHPVQDREMSLLEQASG